MRRSIWTGLVVLALAAAGLAQEKITLKQQYPPGTYVMTMKQDMANTTAMGNNTMTSKMTMLMAMELTAEKPDANGQMLHMVYKRIVMNLSGGPMSTSFDSDKEDSAEDSPMASMYRALVGATIDVTMDPNGNVTAVTGTDQMWDKMAKGNPAIAAMMGKMKEQFGEGLFKELFSQSRKMMPTNPVAVGETWTNNIKQELPVLGKVTLKQDCKLKDIQKTPAGKIAVIEFTGKMTKDEAGPTTKEEGATPTPTLAKLDMALAGTMKLDVDTGLMTSAEMTQKGDMDMSMSSPQGEAMKFSINQNIKTEMETVPGKYKPAAAPTTKAAEQDP